MKSINSKRNFRRLIIAAFLLTAIFYLPASGQFIANIVNRAKALRLFVEASRLFNQRTEESYKQALPKFQEAARIYLTVKDEESAAASLLSAGATLDNLGEKASALQEYETALSLFRDKDKKGEALTLSNMGAIYLDLGESQKAFGYFSEALPLCKQVNDTFCIAMTLNNLGEVYNVLGENRRALDYFEQSLKLISLTSFKEEEAMTLSNIGKIYLILGETQKALEYINNALFLISQTNDKDDKALILSNLGAFYSLTDENQKALDYYNQALLLYRQTGNKRSQAEIFNLIGGVYYFLGENQKALDFYYQALPLNKKVGNKRDEAYTLLNIGTVHSFLGRAQKALDCFTESLLLFRQVKDKSREASSLHSIGVVYNYLNDKQKALDYFYQALQLSKESGEKNSEASTLSRIGIIYFSTGDKQKALDYYNQALLIRKATNDKRGESSSLNNIMLVWKGLKNLKLAAFYGKQSVNIRQQLRGSLQSFDYEMQKSFLIDIQSAYKALAEIFIEDGYLNQSIQVLNLYRDQQFFDFNPHARLPESIFQTSRENKFAELYQIASEKIGRTIFQIEELKYQINNGNGDDQDEKRLKNFEAELNSVNKEFLAVLKRAETEFAKSTDDEDKIPPIKDVTEMQSVLRQLNSSTKQETAVLYTLIGEKKFYIFLITAKGNINVFESAVDKQEFNGKLIQLYALLQRPAYDPRVLGEELYKIIIPKKLEEELKNQKIQTLMWQLDGNLRYIPVAALWDGEKYLVEKYQNVVLTRADLQRLLKEAKPDWTGTGFGSSEAHQIDLLKDGRKIPFSGLPLTKKELTNIFLTEDNENGILKGDVYTNKDFTKNRFYEAMKKRRQVVHISSHFRFYPGDSSLSFLVLGDGEALTLNEMKDHKNLFEGVELLTLSACETGAVLPNADGREIDGFAELAQRLGANAVMASLWRARDNGTADLMAEFYSNRQRKKLNKAESLRLAQLSLIRGNNEYRTQTDTEKTSAGTDAGGNLRGDDDPAYSIDKIVVDDKYLKEFETDKKTKPFAHPYHWAPFVLFGNWK